MGFKPLSYALFHDLPAGLSAFESKGGAYKLFFLSTVLPSIMKNLKVPPGFLFTRKTVASRKGRQPKSIAGPIFLFG